jgi:uncharacterized membrane protein
MAEEKSKKIEEKETGRLESFSDGIFAFAITLLVLGLKDPAQAVGDNLLKGLIAEWPAFFAFFTSFLTILIMWVNHHNMFNFIRRVDTRFMFLNGFLLLTVTLNPFTTSLVADHITDGNASIAAGVYSGVFVFLSIVWNILWRYASKQHRLVSSVVTNANIAKVNRDFNFGTLLYIIAFGLAFVSGLASIIVILLLGVFWAGTASTRSLEGGKPKGNGQS